VNRVQALLEQRAAKLAEWNTAAEAGDDTKASECDAEVTRLDGEITKARETQAKMDEARARGEAMTAELAKPVREPVTDARRDGGRVEAFEPKSEFRHFGEFLFAVRDAARGDGNARKLLDKRAVPTGMSESIPSDGGYLVQKDMAPGLFSRLYDTGALLSRITRTQIGPNSNGLVVNAVDETSRADGSRFGGLRAYWVSEGNTITASVPRFRQIDLKLYKLAASFYATDELMADAVALSNVVQQAVPQELQFKIENSLINGTGAGQPLGILNSGCLVSQAAETGQSAATIVAENLIGMWTRLWARSKPNAVWLITPQAEQQLIKSNMATGTAGALVYMPPGGLSGAPYGTLFGRPVVVSEYSAALGTVGDILLVDMSQYLFIEKGGVAAAESIHVAFLTDQSVFRFVARCNGQPIWDSALTPYKDTSYTVSPFVGLATRS
jgi:HK97 family phage major capsid protein